jgi:uncharacterized membrane protein
MLFSWLHLIALAVYVGAVVGLGLMLLPAASILEKHEEKTQFLARGLKFYNPLQVGALGILLFSGALQVTELKAAYREMFAKQIGYTLGIKLVFAFVLVILSVYQALGVSHRFVKRQEGGEQMTPEELGSIIRRIKSANWGILLFTVITLWLGIRLRS